MLLDYIMDDMTGLALCRRVREASEGVETPIIIVSRFADEMDRMLSFENGADDFVSEPFYPRELRSRILAVIRRLCRSATSERTDCEATFGDLIVDLRRAFVERAGEKISLTRSEFEILRTLIEREGRVVSREALVAQLRGNPGAASARVIDTHVKAIRRKLGDDRLRVETVRGFGYRFNAHELL